MRLPVTAYGLTTGVEIAPHGAKVFTEREYTTMADLHTVPPVGGSLRQQPAPGSSGASRQPEPTETGQSAATRRVGVFDRPEPALVSWSPMTFFVLGLSVLFVLWLLGIFDYLLR